MQLGLEFHKLDSSKQEEPMLLFSLIALTIAAALILALALAASASPVHVDATIKHDTDDAPIKPINMKSKTFVTTHQGVSRESIPVISAAGMQ
jgi:hypothetical protein